MTNNKLQLLTKSKNGIAVWYDPINSHAATHFDDTPQLKDLVAEVLVNKILEDDRVDFDFDMQRIVGTTDVVMIGNSDEIVYAVRKNRNDDEYVPFTKSRADEPSSYVSISMIKQQGNGYELLSAWIGTLVDPPFPGTANETLESKPYWSKYAFVWGSQEIKPGTETKICPWP